ncbi:hypothetical protein JW935_14340 [candidate division KSB1 bacterium]|nr:hypothetical protein [candidate division KSB1 bacterium]
MYKSIEERLIDAEDTLTNAVNDHEILMALSEFGYDKNKVIRGLELYKKARDLTRFQRNEHFQKCHSTQELYDLWESAAKIYKRTLAVARVAFKNNTGVQLELLLLGRRKRSLSGWLEQATIFYKRILENELYLSIMAEFGYNKPKLDAEKKSVSQVYEAHHRSVHERREVQTATLRRNEKLDELDNWMSDFRNIARIALEKKGEQLEKLGIYQL